MGLSTDLLTQFAKITNDKGNTKSDVTIYGTIKMLDETTYVQLDGSDRLTPVASTVEVKDNERVTVTLNNHTATVTGNISSPAARIDTVNDGFTAVNSSIEIINSDIEVINSDISNINTKITNTNSSITNINSNISNINSTISNMNSSIDTLNSDIKIYNSSFQITDGVVTGIKGIDTDWITTKELAADHATISSLDSTYANIDFANIGDAAMNKFYASSGLIKDVTVKDGTITGELIGVTIKGDLIEANTLVANKLVIEGDDGLFYRLNTDGIKVEAQQTDKNSLNGSVIVAKSVTASKISVSDLVAFDATIGGFKITEDSIYSGVKESINNTTRGIYLDNTGQIAFGDATNYLKYYKDSDGSYKLTIASESIDDAAKTATNYLNFSSNGLVVGDCTGDTLGNNILIDSDSVDIRNGETVYASYGSNAIYLGKDGGCTLIDLYNGAATMEYLSLSSFSRFNINSESQIGIFSSTGVQLGGSYDNGTTSGSTTVDFHGYRSASGTSLTPGGLFSITSNISGTNYSTTVGVSGDAYNNNITLQAGTVYIPSGVTTSSDIRLKENISTDMSKYIAMLDLLDPISYTWISEAENPDKKTHISYGSQYVQEAMNKVGLRANDFAGFYRNEENDVYGLCLENFIPILHAKIKQLENRINELETQ